MEFSVKVDRAVLVERLKLITRSVREHRDSMAVVSMQGAALVIKLPDCELEVPCKGKWDGKVNASTGLFVSLAKGVPPGDQIAIAVHDNHLHVGEPPSFVKAACSILGPDAPAVTESPELPLWQLLWTRHTHSVDQLEELGLVRRLWDAEAQRDRLLKEAHQILEPLGVGIADLGQFVAQVLANKNGSSRKKR